ncbi:UDP-glucuronate 4-epimerase [Rhizobium sp. BK619]|uniref:NAD-dependent epimerase/dehydratase family protein n=1 Tax=Rhizobium sp. BK619 TaxID=2586989 RepID=UPI0016110CD9|nr:NAD-dependent epimerase/dehydratase family protein [Rhizobium sp. BK619]MBB3650314.1 UDP-glucuronate 4-epimerase [Rhizobium sp. BK619]
MSRVLVTGAAGFIGFHTACRLLERGETVVGYDIVNDYYDPTLKYARLAELGKFKNFTFIRGDISNKAAMEKVWAEHGPFRRVVHLAAQAGVRYSLENPYSYITSNCLGHITVLEMCRHTEGFEHLVYASSSSVYGGNTELPYSIQHDVNRPISLYAATKRSDELMSYCYSHLFGLKQTGLRFFTVYGPWGRPDMALFIFTKAIAEGEKLPVFNDGQMKRDFTFIDDIVTGILACLDNPPEPGKCEPPARVFNIGNTRSESLMDFIAIIEQEMGRKADIEYLPMQPGDVEATYADVTETTEAVGYRPTTTINEGIPKFVSWFKKYYNIN